MEYVVISGLPKWAFLEVACCEGALVLQPFASFPCRPSPWSLVPNSNWWDCRTDDIQSKETSQPINVWVHGKRRNTYKNESNHLGLAHSSEDLVPRSWKSFLHGTQNIIDPRVWITLFVLLGQFSGWPNLLKIWNNVIASGNVWIFKKQENSIPNYDIFFEERFWYCSSAWLFVECQKMMEQKRNVPIILRKDDVSNAR